MVQKYVLKAHLWYIFYTHCDGCIIPALNSSLIEFPLFRFVDKKVTDEAKYVHVIQNIFKKSSQRI